MMRLFLLLAWLPIFSPAQVTATKRFAVGPAEFEVDADGITVLYHAHDWRPDLSRLPIHANDCQDESTRTACKAVPGIACLECIRDWQPVAWDDLNEILYVSASIGLSGSRTRIVLSYDLRSDQIDRVVDGYPGGFDRKWAVSPSGRYVVVEHAACDLCCSSSHLVIIDTQARRLGIFALPSAAANETVQVAAVRWTGSSMVEYSADIRAESDCRLGIVKILRKITGNLDIPGFLKPRDNPGR